MGPTQLLAATSYAVDLTPDGCRYHGWRVAILASHIAGIVAPELARDVFFAGLLHDATGVGLDSSYLIGDTRHTNNESLVLQKSSALLRWLPGMELAADCLQSMLNPYERLETSVGDSKTDTFVGSQILRLADAADVAGIFCLCSRLADKLQMVNVHTGRLWIKEIWSGFVQLLRESTIYRRLSDTTRLSTVMTEELERLGVPEGLTDDAGSDRVLHILATLVDLKDPSTAGHSLRVAKYAKQLAQVMGLSAEDCRQVYRAGLVHDCGRLGIPSTLLNTSGRLDERGLQSVRKHASMTIRAMSCLPSCVDMIQLGYIAGHDHERYDGRGYPDQLAAEAIPLLSRILSACDAYDAMVTPRDYRMLSPRAGIVRLRQGAGTQFDPVVVNAMVSAVDACEFVLEEPAAA